MYLTPLEIKLFIASGVIRGTLGGAGGWAQRILMFISKEFKIK